mmetsp:Transcript_1211/g.3556  ORF Transcript_1211/g.3556 Transcript_1211/m.3556 type:complete len:237 (-) Transcript_1211:228-938(-)
MSAISANRSSRKRFSRWMSSSTDIFPPLRTSDILPSAIAIAVARDRPAFSNFEINHSFLSSFASCFSARSYCTTFFSSSDRSLESLISTGIHSPPTNSYSVLPSSFLMFCCAYSSLASQGAFSFSNKFSVSSCFIFASASAVASTSFAKVSDCELAYAFANRLSIITLASASEISSDRNPPASRMPSTISGFLGKIRFAKASSSLSCFLANAISSDINFGSNRFKIFFSLSSLFSR